MFWCSGHDFKHRMGFQLRLHKYTNLTYYIYLQDCTFTLLVGIGDQSNLDVNASAYYPNKEDCRLVPVRSLYLVLGINSVEQTTGSSIRSASFFPEKNLIRSNHPLIARRDVNSNTKRTRWVTPRECQHMLGIALGRGNVSAAIYS